MATPLTQTASPPQQLVDLGDDGMVALAASDTLALAGVTVLLPDACWLEWSDSSSSTMCTILGARSLPTTRSMPSTRWV